MLTIPELFKQIREAGEEAIQLAHIEKQNKQLDDAVNWADLRVLEIRRCERDDGDILWYIEIEEASPEASKFAQFIASHIEKKVGFYVIVNTDW